MRLSKRAAAREVLRAWFLMATLHLNPSTALLLLCSPSDSYACYPFAGDNDEEIYSDRREAKAPLPAVG